MNDDGHVLNVESLRTLTATLTTSGTQLMHTGAGLLVVALGFGAILGPDIAKHGYRLSSYEIMPIAFVIAAALVILYRATLRYQFDNGLLRCWWWGRLQWQQELASLRFVEERKTRGGNYLVFTWADKKRKVYLFADDFTKLGSKNNDGEHSS